MVSVEEVRKYLPQYLSDESSDTLFDALKDFPDNIDQRLYTSYLTDKEILFQGDCVKCMPLMSYAENKMLEVPAMIISNTCDNFHDNQRSLEPNVIYAPIIKISKIISLLEKQSIDEDKIKSIVSTIRKQRTSQIFYLPEGLGITEESVVLLDNVSSCENFYDADIVESQRFCSLSNYGFYLLLFKLSLHFTRIREKVDRDKGEIQG